MCSFVVCPAALIQGNHRNCTQFASSKHIDWLVRRLEGQESSKGIAKSYLSQYVRRLIPFSRFSIPTLLADRHQCSVVIVCACWSCCAHLSVTTMTLRAPVCYHGFPVACFKAHSSVYTCLHVSVFDAGRKVEVLVLKLHIISFSVCMFVCHVTNK